VPDVLSDSEAYRFFFFEPPFFFEDFFAAFFFFAILVEDFLYAYERINSP
jgi:hypothetical protein